MFATVLARQHWLSKARGVSPWANGLPRSKMQVAIAFVPTWTLFIPSPHATNTLLPTQPVTMHWDTTFETISGGGFVLQAAPGSRETWSDRLGGEAPSLMTDQLHRCAGSLPGQTGSVPLYSSRATRRSAEAEHGLPVLLQGRGQNSIGRFAVFGVFDAEAMNCVFWKTYDDYAESGLGSGGAASQSGSGLGGGGAASLSGSGLGASATGPGSPSYCMSAPLRTSLRLFLTLLALHLLTARTVPCELPMGAPRQESPASMLGRNACAPMRKSSPMTFWRSSQRRMRSTRRRKQR